MEGNSIRSFENLCKIFEMRIKLDRERYIDTPDEILINYDKYSRKIDSIYNDKFSSEVKSLISPKETLEEEQKRLEKLIIILERRLEKRRELEERYYNATGDYIVDLQPIVSEYELNEKKDRLELITRYLEANYEIDSINSDLEKLRESLSIEEEKKEKYESKNHAMEDELYTIFRDMIKNSEYYQNIEEEELDNKLEEAKEKTTEAKETLDVTRDSVNSLVYSGSNEDYSSYVEDAEKNYFTWKNREIILKIYSIVIKLEDNFSDIFAKREKINILLEERKEIRQKLEISDIDELLEFEKTMLEQLNTLETERTVLENITNITSRIKYKEEKLIELEEVNDSVEILAILREFGLVETYTDEEIIDIPTFEEEISVINEVIDPYRIVEIKDYPLSLNIGLAKLKGESVRERVNKKLNPKKEEISFDVINHTSDELPNDNKPEDKPASEVDKEIVSSPTWEVPTNSDTTLEPKNPIQEDSSAKELPIWNEINPLKEEDNNTEEVDDESSNNDSQKEIVSSPVWEVPNPPDVNSEPKNSIPEATPAVDIPTWDQIKPLLPDYKEGKEEPIINNDFAFNINKPFPQVVPTPIDNENTNITSNININNNVSTNDSSTAFWVPVSDSKLEANEFPNISVPLQNNFNGNVDNFGFPDIY